MRDYDFMVELDGIIGSTTPLLRSLESSRETVIRRNREVVNNSSKAIEAVHAGNREMALRYIKGARSSLEEASGLVVESGESSLLGRVIQNGEGEYVEAILTYSFAFSESPKSLLEGMRISPVSIVWGILDFSGELRRLFLDSLMESEVASAKRALEAMKKIYSSLIAMDVRTSMISGFKKKLDLTRSQIERSTEDLILAARTNEAGEAPRGEGGQRSSVRREA